MLRYVGNGDWLPGVPARNLTDEETAAAGGRERLLATGLYEAIETVTDKNPPPAPPSGRGGQRKQEV